MILHAPLRWLVAEWTPPSALGHRANALEATSDAPGTKSWGVFFVQFTQLLEDVFALAANLAADTDVSVLKVAIINVDQNLGNQVLSTISQQVQEAIKAAGAVTSYAMAINGRASTTLPVEPYVSL